MPSAILWVILVFNPATGEIKAGAPSLSFTTTEECTGAVKEYIRTTPAPPGTVAKGYCLDVRNDSATIVEPGASRT